MPAQDAADPRRRLPSVDRVLASTAMRELVGLYGRRLVTVQVRRELAALRRAAAERVCTGPPGLAGPPAGSAVGTTPDLGALAERVRRGVEAALGPPLRRVLNATGILLHTNLGRSPLPAAVAAGLPALADAYCDLELDLDSGARGERNGRCERLLGLLTGCSSALVANNNAAALVLALATLASGREVVVSRGELVEIGGSFRIPEILAAAGARLVEVGTTNRTRLEDYAAALGSSTALLLKVHPSNYKISGFTASVEAAPLAALAHQHDLPLLVDEGAGLLTPHPAPVLRDHPSHRELLAAGADLVAGSGDKLLGGPQAGLLLGRADLVARCRRHPLYRALRPSRLAYAALEGVLRRQLAGEPPPLAAMWPEPAAHAARLRAFAAEVGGELVAAEGFLGGGAAPVEPLPGEAVAVSGDEGLLRRLRLGEPPVVAYQREGRVLFDLRTVAAADDAALVGAVLAARSVPR
jgi:L-seryl-tRNA(Ser) seleniumtransferase